jgi:hypothetical protein
MTTVGAQRGEVPEGLQDRIAWTLSLPDAWFELDLAPATRSESARRMVEDAFRGNDELWPRRREIAGLVTEAAERAQAAGALYAACLALPTDEGVISASVSVLLAPMPDGEVPDDLLAEIPRGDDPLAPYRRVETVDLPGVGPVPRTSGIDETEVEDGRFVRHVSMVTLVPLRADGYTFVVACSSPVLGLDAELLDLFAALSDTFRTVDLTQEDR